MQEQKSDLDLSSIVTKAPCTAEEKKPLEFPGIDPSIRVPIQGWIFRYKEVNKDGDLVLKFVGPSTAMIKRTVHKQRQLAKRERRRREERKSRPKKRSRSGDVKTGKERVVE